MKRLLISTCLVLAVACGDDDDGGGGMTADAAAGTIDAPAAETVPDPGTQMNAEWTDVEPNDSPGHAVPVGILAGPIWAGFAAPPTQIDTDTDTDFFVFKTGDAASLANVNMQVCWGGAINLADLYLWSVVNNQQGALVKMATSLDTSCETVVGIGEGASTLTADTLYLLEVRAAPGLSLGGIAGMYSA